MNFTALELKLILEGMISARENHSQEGFILWNHKLFPSCKQGALKEMSEANQYVSIINKVADLLGLPKDSPDRAHIINLE